MTSSGTRRTRKASSRTDRNSLVSPTPSNAQLRSINKGQRALLSGRGTVQYIESRFRFVRLDEVPCQHQARLEQRRIDLQRLVQFLLLAPCQTFRFVYLRHRGVRFGEIRPEVQDGLEIFLCLLDLSGPQRKACPLEQYIGVLRIFLQGRSEEHTSELQSPM